MSQDIANSIVGIKDKEGAIQGTGFVVTDKVIVTCEHIIRKGIKAQPGDNVTVVFSALDRVEYPTKILLEGYHPHNDIAILVGNEPFPQEIGSVILCSPAAVKKPIGFNTFGYRQLDKGKEGLPAHGVLVNRVLAVTGENSPSYPPLVIESQQIDRGMSGAPLYLPEIDRVVGIVKSTLNTKGKKKDINTAYAMPAEVIAEAWPELQLQPYVSESLDTQILIILYTYYELYFGQPDMKVNDILKACGAPQNTFRKTLFTLREQGFIDYNLIREGNAGFVRLTANGIRIAEDLFDS